MSLTKETAIANFTRFGYALIPLDLAGHLAHNLFHLLAEGKSVVFTALMLVGIQPTGSPALLDTATIQVFQYLLVVAGTLGSAYTAYRIAGSKVRAGTAGTPWPVLVPMAGLILVLGAVNMYLFYLPMAMRM